MSYSSDVKKEIVRAEEDKKCCMIASIAGFIRMNGVVKKTEDEGLSLTITTENPAIARELIKRIKEYFGVGVNLNIGKSKVLKKNRFYELTIGADNNAEQILRETGIMRVKEGLDFFPDDISSDIIKSRCCKRAFLRGAFLASGTISHPEKSYHMEIVCNNMSLANDVKRLINSFGFRSKIVERRKSYVVYLKESDQISDFLALIGANNQVLKFENIRIIKELRNRTNRIVNCESANLDKTIDSAARQIKAINLINDCGGMDKLPEKLQTIARLRLENPESSLAELGQLLQPPLQKSGVSHRFKKIEEIADKLR
jgi:DNA-binding protein WhiA